MIIKVIGQEATVNSTASAFSNSVAIRIVNANTGTSVLVTRKDTSNTTLATFTIPPLQVEYVRKTATDTFESNGTVGVVAAPIAFN
mgnify:CR=1 FL=1